MNKKGTHKDLVGVGNAIDDYPTNILIKNKASGLIEKYKKLRERAGVKIDTKQEAEDPIQDQRLQPVVAGCLRAPDRLCEAGIVPTRQCKHCECVDATLEHVIWCCPRWKEAREPYLKAMVDFTNETAADNDQRRENIIDLMSKQCVKKLRSLSRSRLLHPRRTTHPQEGLCAKTNRIVWKTRYLGACKSS